MPPPHPSEQTAVVRKNHGIYACLPCLFIHINTTINKRAKRCKIQYYAYRRLVEIFYRVLSDEVFKNGDIRIKRFV